MTNTPERSPGGMMMTETKQRRHLTTEEVLDVVDWIIVCDKVKLLPTASVDQVLYLLSTEYADLNMPEWFVRAAERRYSRVVG